MYATGPRWGATKTLDVTSHGLDHPHHPAGCLFKWFLCLKKKKLSCKWHITAWPKAKSSVGSFSLIPKTSGYQLEPDSQVIFLSHKCRSERHKVIWKKAHEEPVKWTIKGIDRAYPLAKRLAAPSLLYIPQSRKCIGFCVTVAHARPTPRN